MSVRRVGSFFEGIVCLVLNFELFFRISVFFSIYFFMWKEVRKVWFGSSVFWVGSWVVMFFVVFFMC